MAWGARQWLSLIPETTWGVYNSGGTPIPIRLNESNSFDMRLTPGRYNIRSFDGWNRPRQEVTQNYTATGKLTTLLYPSQAAALLAWATNLSGSNPALPSYSILHWDTQRAHLYTGALVKSLKLACAAATNQGIVKCDFNLIAQGSSNPAPAFAEPALSAFPTEIPYTHQDSATLFTIGAGEIVGGLVTLGGAGITALTATVTGGTGSGCVVNPVIEDGVLVDLEIVSGGSGYTAPTVAFTGTATTLPTATVTLGAGTRSMYKHLSIDIDNDLIPTMDEQPFITACYWGGRKITVETALQYLSQVDRQAYESQAPLTCSLGFKSGSHSATFNLNGVNRVGKLVDELPIEGAAYQGLTIEAYLDPVAGSDLTLTVV